MDKTSRGWLIDAVNLICEEIALVSHCQELINSYKFDMENAESWEEITKIMRKLEDQEDIMHSAINTRRSVMSVIYEEYKWDHNMRCSLKHAIWAYQFATECLYANPNSWTLKNLQQKCYEDMISILSLFCWIDEMVTCSRCLQDELDANKNKVKQVDVEWPSNYEIFLQQTQGNENIQNITQVPNI